MDLYALIEDRSRSNPPAKVVKLILSHRLADQVAAGGRLIGDAPAEGVAIEGLQLGLDASMALSYDDDELVTSLAEAALSGDLERGVEGGEADNRFVGVHPDSMGDLDFLPTPDPKADLTLRLFPEPAPAEDEGFTIWVQIEGAIDGRVARSAPFTAESLATLIRDRVE